MNDKATMLMAKIRANRAQHAAEYSPAADLARARQWVVVPAFDPERLYARVGNVSRDARPPAFTHADYFGEPRNRLPAGMACHCSAQQGASTLNWAERHRVDVHRFASWYDGLRGYLLVRR